MIGAVNAISINGKKGGSIGFLGRPQKLSLHFRPPLTHHQVTPTPSPVNSPPGQYHLARETGHHRLARIFLDKRIIFQLNVLAPLAGTILLFIGLIQLIPGAEANPYGIPLIIAGSGAIILGIFLLAMRIFFQWELNKHNSRSRSDVPQIKVNGPSFTDVEVESAPGSSDPPANPVDANKPPISKNTTPVPSPRKEQGPNSKINSDQGQDETSRLLEETENNASGNTDCSANANNGPIPSSPPKTNEAGGVGGT